MQLLAYVLYMYIYKCYVQLFAVVIWSNLLGSVYLGLQPYPSADAFEMATYLKNDRTTKKPLLSSHKM